MGTAELYFLIHTALHSKIESVEVQGHRYKIERTNKNLRYLRHRDQVFAQQDPTQKTPLALLARQEPITRIIRTGRKWGWVSNTEISDPLLKQ